MARDEPAEGLLPDDPSLADVAVALNQAGQWAQIVDRRWRSVYQTDAARAAGGFLIESAESHLGHFMFGTEHVDWFEALPIGAIAIHSLRACLSSVGEWVAQDLDADLDELRASVDPRLESALDAIVPTEATAALTFVYDGYGVAGSRPRMVVTAARIRRPDGELAGTVLIQKPALDMTVLAALGAMGDQAHFARMQSVASAARRPGAVLFADLEGSTPLAKRLSTTSYFALGRRMTRTADQCVVDAGGITGRHSGDGVVAFFLAENLGSESAAARACIDAAHTLRAAMARVAERSNLPSGAVSMRFGLHWGATLYVGLISTVGRTEITALGDDVNDAARIEACAAGARILASKHLVERLAPADADALGIDLGQVTFTRLGDLETATAKARRDAPSIAVCEL